MTSSLILLLTCLLFLRQETVALQVTPGSSCAAICLDGSENNMRDPAASTTNSTDIVCNDQDYSTTASGIRFKSCVECLQESHSMSGEENDISWYLYNLRYSVDVCLYGFPNAPTAKTVSSPCDIDFACRPLKKSLEAGNLNPGNGTQFDYCTADGGSFSGTQLQDCIQCFRSSSNQFYMSNFLTALQAGCEQKPQAGNLIGLSGSLFTQFQVNITAIPQNQTTTSDDTSHTSMTTGAIVGIVIGATLLFLGGTGLFWVYHRKQKYLYGDRLDSQNGRKSISPPLVGGYPHYYESKDNSLPADWELRAQQSYANNADYYNNVEKAIQAGQNPGFAFHPNYQPTHGQHGTLPTHPAYIPRVASRNASRDTTPSPPPPVKSNRPDTYAINAYLNAATAPTTTTTIPAISITNTASQRETLPPLPTQPQFQPPPHLQPQIQPQLYQSLAPPPATLAPRGPSPNRGPTTQPFFPGGAPPPPPPPPPAGQRAPRLSMPTVPKVRKPTKYAPPNLAIETPPEERTPQYPHGYDSDSDDRDEVLSIGFEIMRPVPRTEHGSPRWEQESYAGYGSRTGTPPEQHRQDADRRRRRVTEFTDIDSVYSPNNGMYG